MKETMAGEQGRRDRILDAAEHAFAEHGFAGTSLREIVLRAKVNLATVYYYFDSKQGLVEAVLKRQFGPLRQEQLEGLRRLEEQARGRPLAIEKILEALLLPPLRLALAAPAKRQAIARLIGRIATDPNPHIQEILRRQHAEVRAAFHTALQASVPNLPTADLHWRLEFVWGALTFVLCNPRKIEKETQGACNPVDTGKVVAEMIQFFSPGFRSGFQKPESKLQRPKLRAQNRANELRTVSHI
jgi:AcrR family transcriptional regulator